MKTTKKATLDAARDALASSGTLAEQHEQIMGLADECPVGAPMERPILALAGAMYNALRDMARKLRGTAAALYEWVEDKDAAETIADAERAADGMDWRADEWLDWEKLSGCNKIEHNPAR